MQEEKDEKREGRGQGVTADAWVEYDTDQRAKGAKLKQ